MTIEDGARVVVISPHLDDGVFACGRLLASFPGAVVVTALAGRPASYEPLRDWDRASGFAPGDDVIGARRMEDRAALASLGAKPRWLDFCDSQYGPSPGIGALAEAIDAAVRACAPDIVCFPLGLFHSDHLLTHAAALRIRPRHSAVRWLVYEDAMYRRIPGALQTRCAELQTAGLHLHRAVVPEAAHAQAAKRRAVGCYRSQLKALATPGRPGHRDAYAPEGYWTLDRP